MSADKQEPSPREAHLAQLLDDTNRKFAHTLACLFNSERQISGLDNAGLVWCHQQLQSQSNSIVSSIEARLDHDNVATRSFLIRTKDNQIFECEANHLVEDYHMTMVRPAELNLDTHQVVSEDRVIALILVRRPPSHSQEKEPQAA